jgi:squalene-hopene/tetraprenyl-beta-curcumene cyclase
MLKSWIIVVALVLFGAAVNGRAWNPKAAATYLDKRVEWWTTWPGAARDHDTFCISCHTPLPYVLARPVLRTALGESAPKPAEEKILNSVRRRVRLWNEVEPFYGDRVGANKAAESRGTESVLNALVLSMYGNWSHDTEMALDYMWALQQTAGKPSGAWIWLQFDNEPWEGHDSQ